MAEVQVPRLPPQMAHQQAVVLLGRAAAALMQAMVDRFGSEETQKIIYASLKQLGREIASLAPELGITGNDALALSAITHLMEEQVLRVVGKPTDASSDRVVKQVTACPFQNLPVDVCYAFQPICDGIAEAINPQYRWVLTKAIPKGDPICEFIWEKK
ncbi:MAG: hypothetical protein AMJ38_00405 [Dehalococcoidia bacterium DG_22]|nr:MAG: hypothetical protein AMJ38_00405 [Dehalococcoidia bacterium DG_22]